MWFFSGTGVRVPVVLVLVMVVVEFPEGGRTFGW